VPETIVAARGLGFSYGSIVALRDVTLDVPAGCIGLVGANGAGKTTLLKVLLGILHPGEGAAWALGHSLPAQTIEVRARVGYMPESACLPPDQTAADFVGYTAELAGLSTRSARQRASDVLALVGLHEERFRHMGGFSTGMKQRAKLAQAIVHDPDLVLLDEPTAGLDPEGREEMLALIGRLSGFGINAIVSSHVLTDIERTCQWVVMLDGGRVLRSGPLTEISATDEVAVEVLDDPGPLVAALRAAGAAVDVAGRVLTVRSRVADAFDLVRDALADTGTGVRRVGPRRTTLEDVFLQGDVPAPGDASLPGSASPPGGEA
jgi:ABC-2 type transport system ATP-binding protein